MDEPKFEDAVFAISRVYLTAVETTKQVNRARGDISNAQIKREEAAFIRAVELILRRRLTAEEKPKALEWIK